MGEKGWWQEVRRFAAGELSVQADTRLAAERGGYS